MSIQPKFRPFELIRQRRLMELYDWGKANITDGEMFETIAMNRLTNRALENYGVTYVTALNYAKVVLFKLRKEAKEVGQ